MSLNDSVGILSYVLVSSEHQKQGLGSRLMGQAKQALGGRTMAFYSVENAVPFYKSRNFDTRRFSILVRDFNLHAQDFAALPHDGTVRVVKAQEVDFDKLNAYHTAVQGMDHADYLAQWILPPYQRVLCCSRHGHRGHSGLRVPQLLQGPLGRQSSVRRLGRRESTAAEEGFPGDRRTYQSVRPDPRRFQSQHQIVQ